MDKFFEVLTLCHTVQLDLDSNAKEKYAASSPDEFSFIKFCEKIKIIFNGDIRDSRLSSHLIRSVSFLNEPTRNYELLHILEFDSLRKRMSVIVKNLQTNVISLFSKGADVSIFSKCARGDINACNESIDEFGKQGWRTLALAYKNLSEKDFEVYDKLLTDAYNDINNRDERLKQAYERIESELILVGATAVEDRLQEDVPFTLEVRNKYIETLVFCNFKLNIHGNSSHFVWVVSRYGF